MQRNAMYRDKECESLKRFEEDKEQELAQIRAQLPSRRRNMAEKNTLPNKERMKIARDPHAGAGPAATGPQL